MEKIKKKGKKFFSKQQQEPLLNTQNDVLDFSFGEGRYPREEQLAAHLLFQKEELKAGKGEKSWYNWGHL